MSIYLNSREIDIFEQYMEGNYDLLNKRDQVALDFLLDQLYGGTENALKVQQGARGEWVPTTDEFKPIADAMLLFI